MYVVVVVVFVVQASYDRFYDYPFLPRSLSLLNQRWLRLCVYKRIELYKVEHQLSLLCPVLVLFAHLPQSLFLFFSFLCSICLLLALLLMMLASMVRRRKVASGAIKELEMVICHYYCMLLKLLLAGRLMAAITHRQAGRQIGSVVVDDRVSCCCC